MSEKLPQSYQLKVNQKDTVILMSFAMLNRLCGLLPSQDAVPLLLLDPDLRNLGVSLLLAKRDANGVITPFDVETLEGTAEQMEAIEGLLEWAGDHALNFTLRMAENALAVQERQATRAAEIRQKTAKVSNLASGLIGQGS